MCYLITFVIPIKANQSFDFHSVKEFSVEPFINNGGGHEYGPNYFSYSITHGGCSCNLYSHSELGDSERVSEVDDKHRKKLFKLGWSESKIERSITDSKKAKIIKAQGLRSDVRLFLSNIVSLTGEVRFIVHMHSKQFATEEFIHHKDVEYDLEKLRSGDPVPDVNTMYIVRTGHRSAKK